MSIPYSLTFISVENGKDGAAVNKVYVDVTGLGLETLIACYLTFWTKEGSIAWLVAVWFPIML